MTQESFAAVNLGLATNLDPSLLQRCACVTHLLTPHPHLPRPPQGSLGNQHITDFVASEKVAVPLLECAMPCRTSASR